jgi:phospholipid/cholesterol/gamma-HCH transport system substrate-binding protein
VLPSTEIADFSKVLVRAQSAVDNTAQITERLNKSLEGLTPETFTNIADATQSMAEVFSAIKSEKGFINKLIYSEQDGKKLMDSINATSRDLSAIVSEVKSGKGVLHALVYDDSGNRAVSELITASQSVSRASSSLADVLNAARDGKGLLHDVLYTEVEPGAVAKRLEEILISLSQSASSLKIATSAMADGTGTLGALLVDPRLYDNLIEITDGAKRSFILRQAVRSSLSQ